MLSLNWYRRLKLTEDGLVGFSMIILLVSFLGILIYCYPHLSNNHSTMTYEDLRGLRTTSHKKICLGQFKTTEHLLVEGTLYCKLNGLWEKAL